MGRRAEEGPLVDREPTVNRIAPLSYGQMRTFRLDGRIDTIAGQRR